MSFDLDSIRNRTFVERIEFHEELGSTNDRALQLGRQDTRLAAPLLVLTDRQSQGRGRGAHRWWSARGSLTFSLLVAGWPELDWREESHGDLTSFPPAVAPTPATPINGSREGVSRGAPTSPCFHPGHSAEHPIAAVMGIAVAEALSELLPGVRIGLKWPNDVWLEGRKAGGVLIERLPSRPARLVIGIGLNVNNSIQRAPKDIAARATSVIDLTDLAFDRTEVLVHILQRLQVNLQRLARGTADVRARWNPFCVLTGRTVSVQKADRVLTGTCHGLDAAGALILCSGETEHHVHSGHVVSIQDAPTDPPASLTLRATP